MPYDLSETTTNVNRCSKWTLHTGTSILEHPKSVTSTFGTDELQKWGKWETISTTYVHSRHTMAMVTGRFDSWHAQCMSQAACTLKFAADRQAHSYDDPLQSFWWAGMGELNCCCVGILPFFTLSGYNKPCHASCITKWFNEKPSSIILWPGNNQSKCHNILPKAGAQQNWAACVPILVETVTTPQVISWMAHTRMTVLLRGAVRCLLMPQALLLGLCNGQKGVSSMKKIATPTVIMFTSKVKW